MAAASVKTNGLARRGADMGGGRRRLYMRRHTAAVLVACVAVASAGVGVQAWSGAAFVPYSTHPLAGWSVNGPVYSLAVTGDTLFVGGSFTEARGPGGVGAAPRANLAAFDRNTGALRTDLRFDTNGAVRALKVGPDRLYVGGSFTSIDGVARGRLAALSPNTGRVDPGFSANASSHVYALGLTGGRLYVGGSFGSIRGVTRQRMAAVDAVTGLPDAGFAADADSTVRSIAIPANGSAVYVGGNFTRIGGVDADNLAGVDPITGANTGPRFEPKGVVLDLDVTPAGDEVVAAFGGHANQVATFATSTGVRRWAAYALGDVQAVEVSDGNVYFGFHEGYENGDLQVKMMAADMATGQVETTFRLPISDYWGVFDLLADREQLILGGDFSEVSGVKVSGVAILPPVPAPGATTTAVPTTQPTTSTTPASTGPTTLPTTTLPTTTTTLPTTTLPTTTLPTTTTTSLPAPTTTTTMTTTTQPAPTTTLVGPTKDPASDLSSIGGVVIATGTDAGPATGGDTATGGGTAGGAAADGGTATGGGETPSGALVPTGSAWAYSDTGAQQSVDWATPTFDDTSWKHGSAAFGFGDRGMATLVDPGPDPANVHRTTYFRTDFTAFGPTKDLLVDLMVDDGAAVYLNGVEVLRDNLPTGPISLSTYALSARMGSDEALVRRFVIPGDLLVAGANTLAVEVHQAGRTSSDLRFDLALR